MNSETYKNASSGELYLANLKRNKQLADPDSIARMIHLLSPNETDIACDLGTGSGKPALALAPHVNKIFAYDVNEVCMEAFDEAGLDNIKFKIQDLSDGKIPHEDESLDIVICRAALHHLEEKDLLYRESFRVLKPGGRLYIMDPVMSPELQFSWSILSRIAETDYRSYVTLEALLEGIAQAGFHLKYHGFFLFPRSLREWIDGKIKQKDSKGKDVESDFSKHVKATIWDLVYHWFPENLQKELNLQPEDEEGWFAYKCIELVAEKPHATHEK